MKVYRCPVLLEALLVALSFGVFLSSPPAEAAITYFGEAHMPTQADTGATATNASITPPSNMLADDYVVVYVAARTTAVTISNPTTGGQTWTAGTDSEGNSVSFRIYHCRFNGTWTADPNFAWTNNVSYQVWMVVFRGVDTTTAIDAGPSIANFAADTTSPFDYQIAASTITIATAGAMVVASWHTADDNTWALQTAGWSNPNNLTQWKTSTGSDSSSSIGYKTQTGTGGNAAVTNRQTALGGDAGIRSILALRPYTCGATTDVSYVSASSASSTSVTLNFPSSEVIILRKASSAFIDPTDYPQDNNVYTTSGSIGAATVVYQGTTDTYPDTVTAGQYFYKVVKKTGSGGSTCYATGTAAQAGVSITTNQAGITWSYGRSDGSMLKPGPTGDGKIYPSTNGGYIVSVDESGAETWAQASTGGQSFQGLMSWAPLNLGSTKAVIAADQGGKVYAVNAATGAPLWTEYTTGATDMQEGVAVQLSRYANSSFLTTYGANEDIIFAATKDAGTNNKLYAIKASNGTCCTAPTWSFNGTVDSGNSVAEVSGIPYVDYGRNRIYLATKPSSGGGVPTVQSASYTENGGDVTSHAVTIPSGVQSGDLLLLFISMDGNPTLSGFPAGWAQVPGGRAATTAVMNEVWYKAAAGNETNFSYTSSTAKQDTNRMLRISGWDGTTAPAAAAATGSGNPNPPNLDPANWGQENTLWIASYGLEAATLATGYPTDYTQNQYTDGVGNTGMGIASRNSALAAVASQDPSTFTVSANWGALTVAVRPAAASNGTSLWVINSLTGSSIACSGTDCEMGALDSSPTLSYDENTLYVGDNAGNLYAMSNLSGALTRKWTYALGGGNGNLQGYVWEDDTTAGRLYFTTTTGRVFCVQDNVTSAGLCTDWTTNPRTITGVSKLNAPLLLNKLFAGGLDGRVYQISPTNGACDGRMDIDTTSEVGDVSTGTQAEIFVGTLAGKIYKVTLSSGQLPSLSACP